MTTAHEVISDYLTKWVCQTEREAGHEADAILTALSSAGLAVVPVEPTDEMMMVFEDAVYERGTTERAAMRLAIAAAALPPLASGGG